MTNSDLAKAAVGAALSNASSQASKIDMIEQYLRIGASLVAVISGLLVIVTVGVKLIRTFCHRRKTRK